MVYWLIQKGDCYYEKLSLVLSVLLVLGSFAFATGSAEKQDATDQGLSGKLMIYTSMYDDVIEAIDETLEEVFPTVDIEFFYGGTGTLQAKIAAEFTAGKLGCDMLMVADPSYAFELKEMGVLQPIMISNASDLAFDYDKEGYWYPVRISNMVLAYNPEKVNKADIPNSFYDFAYDPRVAGLISMSNPLTSGTALDTISALKDKYGYEYFTALGKQKVKIESGSVALTKLETGECKVIMILEESVLQKREMDKSKIEVIYPTDGTIVIPSPIMSINDQWSPNKNSAAAKAVTEWFLSEEGQKNIVKAWMHSVSSKYPTPPYDAIPTQEILKNTIPVDWQSTLSLRNELRTRFEEAVAKK
ncbi:extracellular solute-binding protein [Sphaerochaeta halotolerans]|uniref:Extracellular solute-binding protein n=1 Tax=Sphaerochaeta halotolerans TaxID=2293840 RepID=A0A372MGS8_9SPIR|nr:ABC transporter substrate-binding protein [Sphaerochaeta halotolerans]RFU94985.1 extracellular solute-binding protein [Sphaerochaeta halotolerans]